MAVKVTPRALRLAAERAATIAAPALLAAFRSDTQVALKRDIHDVVTVHDRVAERVITAVLQEAFPTSSVLGEEEGGTGDADLQWIVDPIDGTANFARGLAYWCISIGAAVHGEVVAGVILDPVAGHLFVADDTGACIDGATMRSAAASETESTVLTSFPVQHDLDLLGDAAAFELLRELTVGYRHHHSLGSGALNLAHVAAGWSDVTLGFDTHPWDIAAGALILRRAGGAFHGFRSGVPTTRAHVARDYVGVGAGSDHARLVERVRGLSSTIAVRPDDR